MTTIEDRLKEIAEIEAKIEAITAYKEKKEAIEEKKSWIEERKRELETQQNLVADVDPDLLDMMSRSASRSRESRGVDEADNIDDSVIEAKEKIAEINEEIEKATEELDIWEGELERLGDDLHNVELGDLEELQEEKQRLEEQ